MDKKTILSVALVLLVAAMMSFLPRLTEAGRAEAKYQAHVQGVISAIKAVNPGELGFVVNSNPINDEAAKAVGSANVIGSLSFGAGTQIIEAPDNMADGIAALLASIGELEIDIRETLPPGTSPANIFFYPGSLMDGYGMRLSTGELAYIFRDGDSVIICRIPVDKEASQALLAAVGIENLE